MNTTKHGFLLLERLCRVKWSRKILWISTQSLLSRKGNFWAFNEWQKWEVIFTIIKNKNDISKDLVHDLSLISKWTFRWKMLLNLDPTKSAQEVIFSRKKMTLLIKIYFTMIRQWKELRTKNILEYITGPIKGTSKENIFMK